MTGRRDDPASPRVKDGGLPPVPGPDSWSEAEAADWDPEDDQTSAGGDDG